MIRRSFLALALAVVAAPAWAQFDTMTQKPIVAAVRGGDEEKVRQALLKGENPNQIDASGRPLLMIAVMDGDIPVVQALLKGGALPDSTDKDGYTSLVRAAEHGDVDIVDMLLKRNARPDMQSRQGQTALMVASRLGLCRDREIAAGEEGRSQQAGLHRPHRAHLRAAERQGHRREHAALGRRPRMTEERPPDELRPAAPIRITPGIALDPSEIEESFIRAGGPGGQHVNTTSTAVQLRFDVRRSPNLPDDVRRRLERLAGSRLTRDGVLVLQAQSHRSQKRNREEALARLVDLIRDAARPPVPRKKTRPTRASKQRRLDHKKKHGALKALRQSRPD